MEYGKILNRALSITWKYKVLWIVGAVLVLFAGSGASSAMPQWTSSMGPMTEEWGPQAGEIAARALAVLAPLVAVGILFGIVMWIASTIVTFTGEGMLIDMVDAADREQKPVFKDALNRGWKAFWKLFLIQVLVSIGTMIIVLVELVIVGIITAIGVGIFIALDSIANVLGLIWIIPVGLVLGLVTLALLVATGAASTILTQLAYRETMLNDRDIIEAITDAWNTVRNQMWPSVGVWGVQILLGLVVGIVQGIVVLIIAGVAVGLLAVTAGLLESVVLSILIALPMFLLIMLVSFFGSTLYRVAKSAFWTLAFKKLETLNE